MKDDSLLCLVKNSVPWSWLCRIDRCCTPCHWTFFTPDPVNSYVYFLSLLQISTPCRPIAKSRKVFAIA